MPASTRPGCRSAWSSAARWRRRRRECHGGRKRPLRQIDRRRRERPSTINKGEGKMNLTRRRLIGTAAGLALTLSAGTALAAADKTIALVTINQQALFFN